MTTNAYVKLKQILPPAPVLVGLVTAHHDEDDTSTVVLPTNEGRIEYAGGVAVGSTIRARGTTVAVGDKAFVRNGVIETRAPDGDAIEIEVGRVVPEPTPLTFVGPLDDLELTVGGVFSLDVSGEWSGGVRPLAYSLAGDSLPAGLTLSSAGVVSGTPTTVETVAGLVVRATDHAGYRADSNVFGAAVVAPAVRWVAVDTSRRAWYSDDAGATWTNSGHTFPSGPSAMHLSWSGGVFVAAGYNAVVSSFYTSPDGVTWTARTLPASVLCYGVARNGSIFVASALPMTGLGPHVLTSPDGVTWTARTMSGVRTLFTTRSVCWAGDKFVFLQAGAPAGGGTNSATSADGVTWTPCDVPVHSPSTIYPASVLKVGSTYSILPASSHTKIYTTADFSSFTQVTVASALAGTPYTGSPTASNGSLWVCSGATGLHSTTDGVTFTLRRSGNHVSVWWDGAKFVADGDAGLAVSSDGITWSTVSTPFTLSRVTVAHV